MIRSWLAISLTVLINMNAYGQENTSSDVTANHVAEEAYLVSLSPETKQAIDAEIEHLTSSAKKLNAKYEAGKFTETDRREYRAIVQRLAPPTSRSTPRQIALNKYFTENSQDAQSLMDEIFGPKKCIEEFEELVAALNKREKSSKVLAYKNCMNQEGEK